MAALYGRIIALVFAIGLLIAGTLGATAQSYEEALTKFTADSFSDTDDAITGVARSDNPLAVQVIEALQDGRLQFSAEEKKVYIRDAAGILLDAASGNPVAGGAPSDVQPVRINNRLRRSIDAALGGLTLLAPDPWRRLEAANAVFKSKDANALATLDAAIAKETDGTVKTALIEARAAVVLFMPNADEADKLNAVSVIRERGNQEALGLLSSLPPDTPAPVMRAAREGVTSIQNQLAIWGAVQNAWYGLSLGSVLLLAAIGLAITFGVMGVINMAHGEMVMLGAYTTYVVQETIRQKAISLFIPGTTVGFTLPLPFNISIDWCLPIAVPLAFLVS